MDCPYCGKPLVKGYLYGSNAPLAWMPEDKKPTLGIWVTDGEVLKESEKYLFTPPRVTAYKCYECKKMIIDLENE